MRSRRLALAFALAPALVLVLAERASGAPPTFGEADYDFEGNDTLWDWTLSNAIADFADRPLGPGGVDDAAFALERYYASRGFPFARVRGRLEVDDDGEPVVRFAIVEGPRPPVASVSFVGARRFSEERLRSALSVREHRWYAPSYPVEEDLEADADRLENLYVAAGYVDVRVGWIVSFGRARAAAAIIWEIEEGPHTMLGDIAIEGNRAFDAADLVKASGLRRGMDWYPRRASEAREAIERHYRDRGFAFARVEVEAAVDAAAREGALHVRIDEGGPWRFGKVTVRGNDVTRTRLIAREFDFEPGEPYSHAKIRAAERRLYELGLFERVSTKVVPSADDPDAADVRVTVEERPAGTIRVGAGYGSFEQLRGHVAGSYANLFGSGIVVDGRVTASFKGWGAQAGVRDPFILGSNLRLDLDAYYEDRDLRVFDIFRAGGTAFLSHPLPLDARVATGLRYEHSRVTDLASGALVERETIDLFSSIVKLSRDGRDDPIEPRWGTYHEVAYEEAGIFGVPRADFSKVTAAGAYYVAPFDPLTLALGLRAGFIFRQGGEEVPIQERFFLGGDASLRGFELNEVGDPSGGNVFALGSLEARYEVAGPFAVAVFVDAGNIWQKPREMDVDDVRVTPGVGLRVRTPIGPLRLDCGFKADKRGDEDLAEVHFSVGYPY